MQLLKDSVRRELVREAEELRKRRSVIENALRAIKALLSVDRDPPTIASEKQTRGHTGVHARRLGEARTRRRLRKGSLASKITEAVSREPGLTSREIRDRLANRGVSVKGKSSLNDRVRRELKRMVRLGFLKKLPDGTYTDVPGRLPVPVELLADASGR